MNHDNEKDNHMGLPKENFYTIEDILNLPEGERAELINGQIYYFASPGSRHQRIITKLITSIENHISSHKGLCEVFPAPFGVFLDSDETYVEPDISLICNPHIISPRGCEGAPDMIIEIVSESTKRKDYGIKLLKYRTAGVKEYWIVNPFTSTIQVYHFDDEEQNNQYAFSDDIPITMLDGLIINLSSLLT